MISVVNIFQRENLEPPTNFVYTLSFFKAQCILSFFLFLLVLSLRNERTGVGDSELGR